MADRESLQQVSDSIAENAAMAKTLVHMLRDLAIADDEIPDDLSVNDPASRDQRMFACLDALSDRLAVIARCSQNIVAAQQEANHG